MSNPLSQSRFRKIVLVWGAAIVVCSILFALASSGGGPSWLGFFFLLLVITVTAAAFVFRLLYSKDEALGIFNIGFSTLTLLYFIFGSIVALFFIVGNFQSVRFLVAPELILLVVYFVACLVIFLTAREHDSRGEEISRRVSLVAGMEARCRNLHARLALSNPEAAAMLEKISEEIKYFDKNSEVRVDKIITDKLISIDDMTNPQPRLATTPAGPGEPLPAAEPPSQRTIVDSLKELHQLVLSRKDESLRAKTGGF
ncbi:MAG: hypothetical protein LBF41_09555 [Deltaproteobacteria bacterium]|jgi:hypothetical protein|nr:hypothetical protein [Deltaproteobacteria bacterium]